MDAQGRVREIGAAAEELLGFGSRCDMPHLDNLPIVDIDAWFTELEASRAAGQSSPVAEKDLELEIFGWSEGRLVRRTQRLRCRLVPKNAQRSLLPAWMSLSVVRQEVMGREVQISLPLNTSEESMSESGGGKALLEGKKVLLAEDLKSNQVMLQFFLEAEGAEVTVAGNGPIALEQARSGKFDLVFLDEELADLDGAGASRTLRDEGFEGPIVVLTPYLDPTSIESYRIAGCTDHLEKPFNSRELREMAENIAKQTDENESKVDPSGHRVEDQEFMELINEFVASLDEHMHDLEEALEGKDWDTVEALSYRLAGTADLYHMDDLSSLSAQVEELVRMQPGSRGLTQKIADLRTAVHGISGHQLIQDPRE